MSTGAGPEREDASSAQGPESGSPAPITRAAEVARFLRDHPDFLIRHPDLLGDLVLSHECGDASSMIERQLELLRDKNQALRRQIDNLIQVARHNDEVLRALMGLVLRLFDSNDPIERLVALEDGLRRELAGEWVRVHLFEPPAPLPAALSHWQADPAARQHPVMAPVCTDRRPRCGRLRRGQLEWLFGEDAAEIASAALVPLGRDRCTGLLALGSASPDRYAPGMGTVYLEHLAAVITRALETGA